MSPPPDFPRPLATVDVVPLALREGTLAVGTLVRDRGPERGRAALPGGFVRPEEDADVEATARRVLRDKAGVRPTHLEQLAVFSGPDRDPRDWSLSVAFVAVIGGDGPSRDASSGGDASSSGGGALRFAAPGALPALPFDHDRIVARAMDRVRAKGGYSSLPLCFLGEPFTLPSAHAVYERVLGRTLDRAAFRRKILDTGFLEDTGALSRPTAAVARPAKLYRRASGLRYTPRNFDARS